MPRAHKGFPIAFDYTEYLLSDIMLPRTVMRILCSRPFGLKELAVARLQICGHDEPDILKGSRDNCQQIHEPLQEIGSVVLSGAIEIVT